MILEPGFAFPAGESPGIDDYAVKRRGLPVQEPVDGVRIQQKTTQLEEAMPELPEVEVTRRGLMAQLPGQQVIGVWCSPYRLRSEIPRRELRKHIVGQQVETIDRRAKYLLIRLENGAVLVVHLGMTGKLSLVDAQVPRHKHDHLVLHLGQGGQLRFNDSRRFGALVVWPASEAQERERQFSEAQGMEPLGPEFTAQTLVFLAQKRQVPIKSFLMQSSIIAGIGNIYANEILFTAGIHPLRPVNRLLPAQWQGVVQITREILYQAIAAGGSTIADFLGTNGHPGYFQLQLKVYGRKDQGCQVCGTVIEKIVIAGRSTFYCPVCQTEE